MTAADRQSHGREVPLLLLTRPEVAARRFLAECEAAWGRPIATILNPLQAIEPLQASLPLNDIGALILTSEAGAARAGDLGLGASGRVPAWCVGPRTTAVASEAGLAAREAGPDAEGLLAALIEARPQGLLLHLRGTHSVGDIAIRLQAAGLEAAEVVVYAQRPRSLGRAAMLALMGSAPVVAPVFSPRGAMLLRNELATLSWARKGLMAMSTEKPAALHLVALSPAVAKAWSDGDDGSVWSATSGSITIAATPNGAAMIRATLALMDALIRHDEGPGMEARDQN